MLLSRMQEFSLGVHLQLLPHFKRLQSNASVRIQFPGVVPQYILDKEGERVNKLNPTLLPGNVSGTIKESGLQQTLAVTPRIRWGY